MKAQLHPRLFLSTPFKEKLMNPIANTTPSAQPERILARQLARELTKDELQEISGGMTAVITMRRFGNSCSTNSSTVCCDTDYGCDD